MPPFGRPYTNYQFCDVAVKVLFSPHLLRTMNQVLLRHTESPRHESTTNFCPDGSFVIKAILDGCNMHRIAHSLPDYNIHVIRLLKTPHAKVIWSLAVSGGGGRPLCI